MPEKLDSNHWPECHHLLKERQIGLAAKSLVRGKVTTASWFPEKEKEQLIYILHVICWDTDLKSNSICLYQTAPRTVHPKYKSQNIFTSGHLCASWFSVLMMLVITKKDFAAYMEERTWIRLKFHILDSDLSHSRTSPGRTTRLFLLYLPLRDIQILPGSKRKSQGHHQGRTEQPEARRHWFFFF